MPAHRIDSLVIGAGQAGLGVSRELVARGVEHLVLEQGRIGDSWRSQRWDSFALNSPAWMNRLPGDAAPVNADEFPSASQFVLGLERYAFSQRLPVREGVTVRGLERAPAGTAISVATDEGAFEARTVVMASGGARVPRVPAAGAALSASVLQLHAAGYRRAADLPAGGVLVVGGGQSGVQIAEDLLHAGREVYLASSAVGRLPRRYRGRDSFGWLVDDGFFDESRDRAMPGPSPQISGAAGGHTLSYQHLRRMGAVLLGGLADVSGERVAFRDNLVHNIRFADAASTAFRSRIDAHIARVGADAPDAEPDAADEPWPERVTPSSPRRLNLRRAHIRTVIWATGFDAATSFVRAPVRGERGRMVHRDGATALPGLFVTGQTWLRTRRSGTIHGVVADAPHVAELVAARLAERRQIAA
jgi:putative flavoprotein involved in K+ transport